jgi:hypothetical protein
MANRTQTPLELYNQYLPDIDLNAGIVYVAFMEETPENGARVRDGTTGREHLNVEIARSVGGPLASLGLLRRLLARAGQQFTAHFQYIHCEVVFVLSERGKTTQGADKLLAVFVNEGDNVSMRWRHFDKRYKWIALRANPYQIDSMLKFACVTRGEKFSRALTNSVATLPGSETQYGWYCAKHCATMLRALDCPMFHLNRTNIMTVDELYHMVDGCDHFPLQHNLVKTPVVLEQIYGRQAVNEVVYDKYKKHAPRPSPTKI